MQLIELDQDVLLHILASLDVLTALRCSQVCWYFNGLATSKHVWLSLLSDLNKRLLMDLPPPETLLQITVPELIAEVKRVVLGPITWAAESQVPPTIRRQINLPMNEPHYGEPTFIMGGRHLISKHGAGFEIWNVADARREWSREGYAYINVKPSYDDNELSVALVALQYRSGPPKTIEVFKLDLNRHSTHPIFSVELPGVFRHTFAPVLSDSFLGLYLDWGDRRDENRTDVTQGILVVDWQKDRFVLLPGRYIRQNFDFIRGCLIALTETETGAEVVMYSISSFDIQWQPITSTAIGGAVSVAMSSPIPDIIPIMRQRISYPVADPLSPNAIMSIYQCLLCADSFIVAAYFSLWKPGEARSGTPHQEHSMYFRYRVTFPPTSNAPASAPAWRLLSHSATPELIYLDPHNLSYAGYGLTQKRDSSPRTLHSAFAPPEGSRLRPMPFDSESSHNASRRVPLRAIWNMSLERYSSAIAMPMPAGGGYEITYYV